MQLFSSNEYPAFTLSNIYSFESTRKDDIFTYSVIINGYNFLCMLVKMIDDCIYNRDMIGSIQPVVHIA